MKTLRHHRQLLGWFMICLMATWLPGPARAATLYWDSGATAGVTLGGTGTWDTSTANWWNGTADQAWTNSVNNVAILKGTAGTLTLGTGITAGELIFDTAGYSITGNTLTLGAGANVFANVNASISSVIAGTNWTKAGLGTLTLSGANTFTGALTLSGGTVRATTSALALGTGSTLTLNGGVLQLADDTGINFGRATTVSATSMITADRINSGSTSATQTLGALTMGSGQNLIVTGGSNFTGGTAGLTVGALTLSGTNTFTVTNPTAGGSTLLTFGNLAALSNSVIFNGNGAATFAGSTVTVTGNSTVTNNGTNATALNLGNLSIGAFTLTAAGPGAITVGGTTTLTGAAGFTNAGIGTLTVGTGTITNGANLTTLIATSAGNINVSGAFTGATAGGITVNSTGPGVVTLSGNNTETGTTTLTAGILRATTNTTALGAAGALLQLNGGTLQLTGGTTYANTTTTVGGAMTILNDNTTLGAAAATADTLSALNLGAFTLTISAGQFVNSGNAKVTFGAAALTGAGTINTNNSFYTANPFLSTNAVTTTTTLASLNGAFAAVIGGTGNTIITGGLGSTLTTLTKNNIGTLTLGASGGAGVTNLETGTLTINAGTVNVYGANATATNGAFSVANALSFGAANIGGGTFTLNSGTSASAYTQAMGALTVLGGSNTLQSVLSAGATSTSLTFSSLVTMTNGASLNFVTTGGTNGSTNSINITGAAVGLVGSTVVGSGAYFFNGVDFAFMNAAGTYVRAPIYGTDAATYTVGSGISGWNASPGSNGLVAQNGLLLSGTLNSEQITMSSGSSGLVAQNAAVTIGTLKLTGPGGSGTGPTLATGALVTLQTAGNSTGGIIATGGASTIYGIAGITSGGSGAIVLNTPLANDSLAINAPINGTGGIVVTGLGKVTLSNPTNLVSTNSGFTGNIFLNGGTLSILGTGISDPLTLGAAGARTIFLNGGTFQLTGTNGIYTSNKVFSVGTAGGMLDLGSSALTISLVGTGAANEFTGTGNLTIGGNTTSAGLLFLNDASNFSGNIYVGAGTLRVGGGFGTYNTGAGTATVIIGNGANFDVAVPGIANSTGTGNAIANALILSGTGSGINGGGALQNTSSYTNILSGGITLAGNATITTGANGNIIETGTITDSGNGLNFGLTKAGAGTLYLTGISNYTGGTTVAGGTLQIGYGAQTGVIIGNTSVSSGATLAFNRTDSTFYAGNITGAGSVVQAGVGILSLYGNNSYSGATTVNSGGTLSVIPTALAGTLTINVGTQGRSSTLDLTADGVGAAITLATNANVNLGGASTVGRLNLQVGSTSAYDALNLSGTGAVVVGTGGAILNVITLPGFNAGTYNLINGATSITGGAFTLSPVTIANLASGIKAVIANTGTAVTMTVSQAAAGNFYWNGANGSSWYANTSNGAASSWSTSANGTGDAGFTPGASNIVNFSGTNITGTTAVTTTLDQNYSILGIAVNNSSTGNVTVNQGSFGAVTLGAGGITINTGGPAVTALNVPIALIGAQTWTVTDAGETLAVNLGNQAQGIVSGAFGITQVGAGTLSLGGFNTFTGGITSSGGGLIINNGGSTTTNSAIGTGAIVFGAGTTLDNTSGVSQAVQTTNNQTWNGNLNFTGSNSLSLGGTITLGANRNLTVSAGTLVLTGVVQAGAFGITKQGAGALTLSGANLNTGLFTLSAGTVNVNNAAALGAAAATVALNGGTINNTSGAAVVGTTAGAMTFGADVAFGGSGALTLPGAVTLAADRTITTAGPGLGVNTNALTLSGIISGNFNLVKAGNGALILSAINTFGGAGKSITLNAGTLILGVPATQTQLGNASNTLVINGGALDVTGNAAPTGNYAQTWGGNFGFVGTGTLNMGTGNVTMSQNTTITVLASTLTEGGAIQTTTNGLTINGPGTVALTGANLYSGATTVNAGSTLNLGAAGANGSLASTALNLNGGTFAYTRTGSVSQSFTGTTLGSGASLVTESVAASQTLNLGAITRNVGGTVNFTLTGTPAGTTGVTTSTTNTSSILGGWATIGGGASWAVANGATSSITALGTYVNDTWAAGNNTTVTGSSAPSSGSTTNSLRFNVAAASTITLAGVNTITSGGILLTPTVAATNQIITGGTIQASSGNDLIINQWATTGTLAINSIIAGNGGLTKSGTTAAANGIAIIGGSTGTALAGTIQNTFTGGVYLNAGTLQVNSSSVSGGNGATGALNSNAIVINGASTAATAPTLAIRADGDASSTTQAIAMGNNITINGGFAAINADRLGAGNPISATPLLFTTALNKTIQFGSLGFNNDGSTLVVTPVAADGFGVEFTGTTTINKSFTTINSAGTFTASNVVQGLTFSGQVTGSPTGGVWTKSGTGVLVLNNATNNFIANVNIAGGMLAFNSDGALGATSNGLFLNASATNSGIRAFGGTAASPLSILLNSGRTITFNNATVANNVIEVAANTTLTVQSAFGLANNGFTKADNGTLILAADNSAWSGAASITAGALRITNSGALGLNGSTAATGLTTVTQTGAALQLANSVNIFEQTNITGSGINTAGAIESVSGGNIVNGLITLPAAATIGSDANTLTIRGGHYGQFCTHFRRSGQYHGGYHGCFKYFGHRQTGKRDNDFGCEQFRHDRHLGY